MPINSNISGGRGGNRTADIEDGVQASRFKPRGLITYGLPYEFEVNAPRFATSETNGNAMAVNGTSSGASDGIHDGIDTTLWTAAATAGTWTFNSTTQANTGTRSIDATATVNNDRATLTRSSAIAASTYNTLEGFIYIQSWPNSGTKNVQLAFQLAGMSASSTVNVSDYINVNTTGSWQSFIIPLAAFGISSATVDQLTVTTISTGGGQPPNYYLDDMKLQATSAGTGPQTYTVAASTNEVLRVYGISWTIIDNYTPSTSVGATLGLPYNKFGALTKLVNGVSVRRIQREQVLFTNSVTNHAEIINGAGGKIEELWYDGTNVYLKSYTRFAAPVELNGQAGDRFEFVVQDNLSSLIQFDIRVDAALLERNNGNQLNLGIGN
jgi:hypothetical protein